MLFVKVIWDFYFFYHRLENKEFMKWRGWLDYIDDKMNVFAYDYLCLDMPQEFMFLEIPPCPCMVVLMS